MAAFIARQSYLFCRYAKIKDIKSPLKHKTLLKLDIKHISQPSVWYAAQVTSNEKEAQVRVPVERLTVSYSRSGGPGGQHVNKVNTKAEVRFHLHTADWIPEDVRQKIFEQNKNRINKAGELFVTSEQSRSQHRNLVDCIEKISAIITEASKKPQEPTAEDIALKKDRLEKKNKERLKQKKMHAVIKQSRQVNFD
ncbi:large ribosomal subunit protein mL62 [Cynoglossus semilaevis]|uniref:Large ribosomal subunit protein mL62 n=1 Tax=Cynoglossus semilaevis TaxID=244447 RepID=A0A3P8WV87_CYNSE|nr:peptidyl-tRNA hydrolase ICT1, mitochondrial [Cynoglossus semilaevis]